MSAINFLTDADGRRKAIVIDLDEFKRLYQSDESQLTKLLEDVEDILCIELHKDEPTLSWLEVEQHLQQDGLID